MARCLLGDRCRYGDRAPSLCAMGRALSLARPQLPCQERLGGSWEWPGPGPRAVGPRPPCDTHVPSAGGCPCGGSARAPRAVTSFPVLLVPPACLKGARSPLRQAGSCSQPGGRRRGPLCSLQPQGRAKSFPAGRSASFASLHPAKERPSFLGVTAETGWQRPCMGSGPGG
ncbi:unnamed protein product [Lepidochelys olivacea]